MSLPGKDFRCELSHEVHAVLKAVSEARGIDMGDIVRDVLATWAQEQIHAATVLHTALVRHGVIPESPGTKRNRQE